MIGRDFKFHDGGKGAALAVRVKAGGKVQEFKKVLKDGTVVVGLKGEEKDWNDELLDYLAKSFNIQVERLQIIAGKDGNNKLISILDMEPGKIQQIILAKFG